MLIGGSTFGRGRSRCVLWAALASLIPAALWYVLAQSSLVSWPSGSTPAGFWCGATAGAIVLFEMALWVRKKLRGRRTLFFIFPLGMTRRWMFWHIWLGLLAIPLAIIHSGFHFGGPLSAWTLGLFLAVSASGIWGLWLQQWMPRRLLDEIPEETVAAGIDHVMETHRIEAERMIYALTDPAPAIEMAAPATVGIVRIRPLTAGSPLIGRLRDFFRDDVAPYLKTGAASSRLGSAETCRALFDALCRELPEHAHVHARSLEKLCAMRRQLDQQRRIDRWLHGWLLVHFPLSVSLLVLLAWHAAAAIKLW